jgi:hypothetical protein
MLATELGSPMTAGPAWGLAACAANVSARPWALMARDPSGAPLGAVVLVDQTDPRGTTQTALAGTDGGHRGAILTADPEVARVLGHAFGDTFEARGAASGAALGPLPAGCPVVAAFADGLTGSRLEPVAGIPVIRADAGPESYLSDGMRRTLRKARNRLAADGLKAVTTFTQDAERQLELVPQLEHAHRHRDHVNGRISDIDDVARHRTWRRRFRHLAESDALELAMLHIDDTLAAYALGVVDGSSYRLLEGRFVSPWARYSPGRIVEAETVLRAFEDDDVTTFDWMTSVAPDSLLGSNDVDPMVVVQVGDVSD